MSRKHNHYYKDVRHLASVDIYRVLLLFGVTDPCLQHALKKIVAAGGRGGGKDANQDIEEAVDSLTRWQEMREEDKNASIDILTHVCGGLSVFDHLGKVVEGCGIRLSANTAPECQPDGEAMINAVDPAEAAWNWFDANKGNDQHKAFKTVVRALLKALDIQLTGPVPLDSIAARPSVVYPDRQQA